MAHLNGHVTKQQHFLLVDGLIAETDGIRPPVLAGPPHNPRPQYQEGADWGIATFAEVVWMDLLRHKYIGHLRR